MVDFPALCGFGGPGFHGGTTWENEARAKKKRGRDRACFIWATGPAPVDAD